MRPPRFDTATHSKTTHFSQNSFIPFFLLLTQFLQTTHPFSISTTPISIALTREIGKNTKLQNTLQSHPRIPTNANLLELPCIKHADGPDRYRLASILKTSSYDYVVITSPEAANVFATAWTEAGKPEDVSIASVGMATKNTLETFGIRVDFVPSKATAKTLCVELPQVDCVLYPASSKAKRTLQNGLNERNIKVDRLNTYDTVKCEWERNQIEDAKKVDVVCFASPSSVKGWVENSGGKKDGKRIPVACIGETSAEACREMGWEEDYIYFPEKPGVEGWADAVADAVERVVLEKETGRVEV